MALQGEDNPIYFYHNQKYIDQRRVNRQNLFEKTPLSALDSSEKEISVFKIQKNEVLRLKLTQIFYKILLTPPF